jgi:FKBP-type peptidyl-prolyl cis-trans isomerase FklB
MVWMLAGAAFLMLHSSLFISCSESDEDYNEYEAWQERNDAFFATLEDSLQHGQGSWKKLKSYSKNPSLAVGSNTDCIYARVLADSSAVHPESPMFSDSVRVSYLGRLIPSASYPQGYVFDSTVYGKYDPKTNATVKFKLSALVPGFATALQHMHQGDTWRIYIPYNLGYGSSEKTSIPAYSTLIFDLTLVNFAADGHQLPVWR